MSTCLCNSGEFWQKPLGCLMSAVSSKPNKPSTSVDRPATSTSATTVWRSASFAFRSSANFKGCGTTIFTTCRLFMLVTRVVNSPTFQKCKADPCQSCSIRIVPCWGSGTCGTSSRTIRQVFWQAQWFRKTFQTQSEAVLRACISGTLDAKRIPYTVPCRNKECRAAAHQFWNSAAHEISKPRPVPVDTHLGNVDQHRHTWQQRRYQCDRNL